MEALCKRPGTLVLAGLASLALVTLAGCNGEVAASASAQALPQVTVALPLVREVTDWDEYTGRLAAAESVELYARISGYLMAASFDEGAMVKKGDLLFVIDRRPYETALAAARATLEGAEARLELAELNIERAAQLVESRMIPQRDYDAAIEERKAAAAALASAKAAVRSAELDLGYCEIRAPISGRVGRRLVTEGNYVTGGGMGATMLTTLVSLDPIHVYINADERAYLRYQRLAETGTRPSSRNQANAARLGLADEEGHPHEGLMDFVDNQVDPDTGTVLGRAVFPNPDNVLTPGMFARVQILGPTAYEALLVPDAAIVVDQSRRVVYVVDAEDTIQARMIEPGRAEGQLRVIRDGLETNDRVVINGLQRVRPGMRVDPVASSIDE